VAAGAPYSGDRNYHAMLREYKIAGHQLRPEWISCLELALEGTMAGSFGIAAVITKPDGTILSRGRNQLFDAYDSVNIVKMSSVAHAEINALANLAPKHRQDRSLRLFTTVEPCPMCLGAIAMSWIRQVYVGSRDNWASVTDLLTTHPYLRRKKIQVYFPEHRHIEILFLVISAYSILKNGHIEKAHQVFQTWREISNTAIDMAFSLNADEQFSAIVEAGDKEGAIAWVIDKIEKS
jgi:tRNA(adenine34) deaminase